MNRGNAIRSHRAADAEEPPAADPVRRSSATLAFDRLTVPPEDEQTSSVAHNRPSEPDAGRYTFVDPSARRRRR